MKLFNQLTTLALGVVLMSSAAQAARPVASMSLTEIGNFKYDAAPAGQPKKPAQIAVDELKRIGVKHVVLNPQAKMTNPKGNDVIPNTPIAERAAEAQRYQRLIAYIHSQGMTVGIRPIFFLVKPDGSFPFLEVQPDGTQKLWWHGNILPAQPFRWFQSFQQYLDIYMLIAKVNRAEEFTIGAELYSMTVGIEDQQDPRYKFGFPASWVKVLKHARTKLGANVRIMYDINFTDDSNAGGTNSGGELERWRYRIVDMANPPQDPAGTPPDADTPFRTWKSLVAFWNGLDAVGIDMYRSLADRDEVIPADYNALVALLTLRAEMFANQLYGAFTEINMTTTAAGFVPSAGESTGTPTDITHSANVVARKGIFKEVGYRSTTKGFIDPFNYAMGNGDVNINHQAAAFQAFFNAFWVPGMDWFGGVSFWDTSVNPGLRGANDAGFSPIGKAKTEQVIRTYFAQ